MHTCQSCGQDTCEHDRQARFQLPDPVLNLKKRERTRGTWMSHGEPNGSVFMNVPKVGCFLRALLPISLSGGYSVTYGVWIGARPEDAKRAFDTWWEPSYVDLEIEGLLANTIEPWSLLGSPVSLAVLDPDATPYVVASTDTALHGVLTQEWPAEQVLPTLP